MEPKKDRKKELVLSTVGVMVLIALVFASSYAIFTYSKAGTKENKITTGTVTFSYNESTNGIELVNAKPLSDAAGKVLTAKDISAGVNQGYFDFTVSGSNTTNSPITYEVYATLDSGSTLDPEYIKVYLTDGKTTETAITGYTATVPTYNTLTTSTSDSTGKRLYTETFSTNNYSKTFRLRIWVADTYTLTGSAKTATLRVNVKALM